MKARWLLPILMLISISSVLLAITVGSTHIGLRQVVATLVSGADPLTRQIILDLRLPRADTVLWFDLPRHLCLRRVVKRIVTTYGQVRPDMAPGCPERFDLGFLKWIWNFNRIERPRIQAMLELHGTHLTPIIFRRARDVSAFLASVAPSSRDN